MTRRTTALLAAGALTAGSVAAAALTPAAADTTPSAHLLRPLVGADSGGFPSAQTAVGDADRRGPRLAVPASRRAAADALGTASWTQFGTPRTLTAGGAPLASGLVGTPAEAARSFLRTHATLLGLDAAAVDALELATDATLSESTGHVVTFRQVVAGLPLAEDGLVAVTVRGGKVFALTSSAVPTSVLGTLAGSTPTRSATAAVLAAARDAGVTGLSAQSLEVKGQDPVGFTLLTAAGLAQPQRARLRAVATTDRGVRLAWEVIVQDVRGPSALAVTSLVDDATGEVLVRRDAVDTLADGLATAPIGSPTQGSYTAPACSDPIPMAVDVGTQTIVVVAAALDGASDITVQILRNGDPIASGDLLSSPEYATASLPAPSTDSDVFAGRVCPYDPTVPGTVDFVFDFATSSESSVVPALPDLTVGDPTIAGPATFRAFRSNPSLDGGTDADRSTVCVGAPGMTTTKDLTACDHFTYTDDSRNGYDTVAGFPTQLTSGNNALTSNAQLSTSLTPGPPATPGVGPGRDFAPAFDDLWAANRCSPAAFVAADPADIQASIVNLFAGHNQIHDFAYRLGLVEETGALQLDNFGKAGASGDPELGNAQNAAITNPVLEASQDATVPTAGIGLTGRNNANQITLQDGVPGITNQYLFEPIVGFYAPCADGDLDATIFLHEYTHAISNRLVGGPANGLSGQQSGSMGESWSDLVAIEYLQAFGLAGSHGEDTYALGAYATGNTFRGIRDFNLRPENNPLTYGQFGFDATGPEVHADGEVWNAIQMRVRQALIAKYDALGVSSTDAALQEACALGRDAAGNEAPSFAGCPGNRRWVTYLFDSMLMQANGSPTMVDMKDLMLAAAGVRGGADVEVMGNAFAERGLGAGANAVDAADTTPNPGYDSPTAADNATVTFAVTDAVTGAASRRTCTSARSPPGRPRSRRSAAGSRSPGLPRTTPCPVPPRRSSAAWTSRSSSRRPATACSGSPCA